jgi:hypothetical protein
MDGAEPGISESGSVWTLSAPREPKNTEQQIPQRKLLRKRAPKAWIRRPLAAVKFALPPEEWSWLRQAVKTRRFFEEWRAS